MGFLFKRKNVFFLTANCDPPRSDRERYWLTHQPYRIHGTFVYLPIIPMALDLRDLSMDKTPRYQQDELDFGVNYMKMFFLPKNEWSIF